MYSIRTSENRNRIAQAINKRVIVNAPGNTFDPSTISGLTFWMKGDVFTYTDTGLTTPAVINGDNVKGWKDNSSSLKNPTSPSFPPTLAASARNGLNAVRFSKAGSGTWIGNSAIALSNYISASAMTMFVVFKYASITTSSATTYQNDTIVGDEGQYFGLTLRQPNIVYFRNWDGNDDSVSKTLAADTWCAVMCRHEGGNIYLSMNNDTEVSAISGNTSVLTNWVRLGASGSFTFPFDGYMAELLIYNVALTALQIGQVYSYLNARWSLY